ncbi:3-dehydroquinate synthase [Bacillaceae bacterium W0354]
MSDLIRVISQIRKYNIHLGNDIRHDLNQYIQPFSFSKIAIITDENVANLYLNDVQKSFDHHDIAYEVFIVQPGEKFKTLETYEKIQKFLLNNRFDRNSAIVALGGGVIGDLSGFVAATYMRGIGFIQLPTTLLAHDSSIGGKVAVNLNQTKNIIGAFYPPHAVIYDTNTLHSLNSKELRSGFAEMVKHGWIADRSFLRNLLHDLNDSINIDSPHFKSLLKRSIEIKQLFIERDEYEGHVRKYLNFGHTLGHAIESTSTKNYSHGECVMYGMMFALFISDQINEHTSFLTDSYIQWVKRLDYPLNMLDEYPNIDLLINKMIVDKKSEENMIQFVLLSDITKPILKQFTKDEVKELLLLFKKFMTDKL